MRQVMTKAQAVRIAVFAVILIAIITIFPLRLWHESISTSGKEHPAGAVAVSGDAVVMQQFSAEYDHIDSIGVFLNQDTSAAYMCMRVFNQNFALLREEYQPLDVNKSYSGYVDVYINLDTVVGDTYYYSIECADGSVGIPFEMTGNSGTFNNGAMQYAGETREAYNLVTRYTYSQPLRKTMSLIIIVVLLIVGFLADRLLVYVEKKVEASRSLVTLKWIIKIICNPLIVIAAVFAIVCVGPLHMFSIYIADIVVLILGILFLAALLLYAVNREDYAGDFDLFKYLKTNWSNLLQALCIALALWACVNYMNALYEVFHDIAWRKMAFFLGLGLIVTFAYRELINWYNLAMLIIGVIAGRLYYVKNLESMVDDYHTEAMLWTCRLFPIVLILTAYVVRMIIITVKNKTKVLGYISWPYAILTVLMAAAMIIRRNTRYWPVMMTVIAVFIALRFIFWEQRAVFLNNICNGILLHFAGCILYCLWHRPYEAFIYVRYPFVFHTVTITAEYLSLVFAAALVKLFAKYYEKRTWKACIWEMTVFGTATSYVLFTMSRTGMIAIVATGFTMWIAYSYGKKSERIKSLAGMALMVIASVMVCFPICFSLQKTIPAVVGEPKIMIVESYPEEIMVSTEWDSDQYITFSRFAKAFGNKMFGINEDKIRLDIYTINGRQDDAYNKPNIVDYMKSLESSQVTPDVQEDMSEPTVFGDGIMLTGGSNPNLSTAMFDKPKDSDFVPPHEYQDEGEPPEEWWDPDYWYYNRHIDEWIFNTWKLEEDAKKEDISNGRMDIYRAYYDQLTPEGHEGMGAILNDGSEAAHAHDIYLQVAYDHGIIVGALFALWVAATCIQALVIFIKSKKRKDIVGIPLAMAVTYAVAGITEWISHPCNPVGMVLLIVVVPMALCRYGKDKETV